MPRIYVADLAAYNAGHLHGAWIEATSDADAMQEQVDAMLAKSPVGDEAEEYAIHDVEGISLSEYTSLDSVAEKVAFIEKLEDEFGDEGPEIFAAFEECFGRDATDDVDTIRDAYRGKYRSEREYAEQFVNDIGMLHDVPDDVRMYFDYEAYARDLFINDVVMSDDGHVFSRHW